MTEVQDILDRHRRMAAGRESWDSHWQELAELLMPRRADFTAAANPGDRRNRNQFDGTPMMAARALAAAVDGLLKGRSSRWFHLRTDDRRLDELAEVKLWLEAAEARLYDAIYEPQARFLQRSAEVDLDLVVFGTGVLFVGEARDGSGLHFRSHHLKDVCLAESVEGEIDTLYRTFPLTACQAVQKWPAEKLGRKVREALDRDKSDDRFTFLHAILPREEYDPRRRSRESLPFASLWIDVESETMIDEGGYHEFPYVVPRWDTAAGEVYGRSPGMLALPDVQTLNQMGKTLLKAGQKAVDPPLLAPDESIIGSLRTWPGGITYFDPDSLRGGAGRPPITPLVTGANLPLGLELEDRRRDLVWSAFFRNVLQLPVAGPQMTATEVLERKEEFVRTIGGTFGRLEAEYTAPLVQRAFAVLLRLGLLPAPPETLRGVRLAFEYASPVTKVQRQIEATALRKTAEDLLPVIQARPEVLDNFDHDRVVRDVAEANGLPQRWLRPVEAVAAERAAQVEAAAEATPGLLAGPGIPA